MRAACITLTLCQDTGRLLANEREPDPRRAFLYFLSFLFSFVRPVCQLTANFRYHLLRFHDHLVRALFYELLLLGRTMLRTWAKILQRICG